MKTLLLVRHAHTGMAGRFCGHSDPDLSETGQEQLPEIVERVRRWPVSAICASDLRRACRTAQAIASPGNLPVELRPALREIYFGGWEERSWAEIEAGDPATASAWLRAWPHRTAPDGEPFHRFEQRVKGELAALAGQRYGECVAAVTHAGFIGVAMSLALGVPVGAVPQPAYGAVTGFQLIGDAWAVKKI